MITFLFGRFGTMNDADMTKLEDSMRQPWDPNTEQIEALFARADQAQQIAAAVDPISNHKYIRKLKGVITKTGIFNTEITEWDSRMPAHQTKDHFKEFWTNKFCAYISSPEFTQAQTAQQAGYNAQENQPAVVPQVANNPQVSVQLDNGRTIRCGWCSTHGMTWNPQHNSRTCRNKGPNHNDEATIVNMLGGNNKIPTRPPRATRAQE